MFLFQQVLHACEFIARHSTELTLFNIIFRYIVIMYTYIPKGGKKNIKVALEYRVRLPPHVIAIADDEIIYYYGIKTPPHTP